MSSTHPPHATGLTRQSSTELATPFTAVTKEPVIAGTNYSVTLPGTAPSEFFRLRKP